MQVATIVSSAQRTPALTALFLRYVTGQIEDANWNRVSCFVDSVSTATAQEREAMAAFVHDAVLDLGADGISLPTASEAENVLEEIRSC